MPKLERRHWLGTAVLALAAALYLVAGISVTQLAGPDGQAYAKVARGAGQAGAQALPAPEPLQFKQVKPEDAVAINAAVPISTLPNPAASPFFLRASSELDRQRSLECLTAAVYYEAATEGVDGQRAVAQVVLNRLRHPAYPGSVCGVVFQGSERATGCQFTFTCDGSIARAPHPAFWARARAVAWSALNGYVHAPVGWATHYHTNWVVPYWSSSLVKLANVGTHIFYRWEGGWGRPAAFTGRHKGTEPVLPKMAYIGVGAPVEEVLTPEQQAALASAEATAVEATAAADAAPATGNFDLKALSNRAVIRRFEPARREDIAVAAKQTPAGAKVEDSTRWALTGGGTSGEALGSKQAAAPAEAKAAN
ncbi:MAG TPA: cell wall hydrolase [Allosphingosinicella sp.]|nr:cell wall hydrolase [Allosphingosinicella sp.]